MKTEVLSTLCLAAVLASSHCAAGNLFSSQSCNPLFQQKIAPSSIVTIKYLKRPMDRLGETVQTITDEVASHVQIVAFNEKGTVIDNFGLTGEKPSMSITDAEIEIEFNSDILKRYDQNPLGTCQMSYEAYLRVRDETEKMAKDGFYSPLNAKSLESHVVMGAAFGALPGGKGVIAGAVSGGMNAVNDYKDSGGRNLAIVDGSKKENVSPGQDKMSFPGRNCHYLPILFEQLAALEPTYVSGKPYSIPGITAQNRVTLEDALAKIDEQLGSMDSEKGTLAPAIEAVPAQHVKQNSDTDSASSEAEGNDASDDSSQGDNDSQGDTSGMTPKEVTTEFFNALKALDDKRAVALSTPESEDSIGLYFLAAGLSGFGKGLAAFLTGESIGEKDLPGADIEFSVSDGKINGDEAEVEVSWKMDAKAGTARYPLRKIDGAWKIVFVLEESHDDLQ